MQYQTHVNISVDIVKLRDEAFIAQCLNKMYNQNMSQHVSESWNGANSVTPKQATLSLKDPHL